MIGGGVPQGRDKSRWAQADDLKASIKVCMFDQYASAT
jgi:hypothetical protein